MCRKFSFIALLILMGCYPQLAICITEMLPTGAYAYANQGYDYRQILGAYYPGVAIARLESER